MQLFKDQNHQWCCDAFESSTCRGHTTFRRPWRRAKLSMRPRESVDGHRQGLARPVEAGTCEYETGGWFYPRCHWLVDEFKIYKGCFFPRWNSSLRFGKWWHEKYSRKTSCVMFLRNRKLLVVSPWCQGKMSNFSDLALGSFVQTSSDLWETKSEASLGHIINIHTP